MSRVAGRIAIVVGGPSGIGWATAQGLAAEGCRVAIADRNADGAKARADELGEPHAAAVQAAVDDVVGRSGRLAIIDVNIRGSCTAWPPPTR
jgi:3-oxoacyl-[acyl-carrier protein] reductase